MFSNPLRARLQNGATTYGLWVTLESPTVTELAVLLGLDWVCIDMEHGHLDYGAVMAHLRTVRDTTTTAIVRIPEIQQGIVKRVLDMGAQGIILPLVSSRAEYDRALSFGRYPPVGIRSIGGERAVQWGLDTAGYLAAANREVMMIPLIETRGAVEQIDAILDTPGLEAIFFGPADMSSSYGYPGQWEGPGVAEHILDIRAKAQTPRHRRRSPGARPGRCPVATRPGLSHDRFGQRRHPVGARDSGHVGAAQTRGHDLTDAAKIRRTKMITIAADDLRTRVSAIFGAVGTPPARAARCGRCIGRKQPGGSRFAWGHPCARVR